MPETPPAAFTHRWDPETETLFISVNPTGRGGNFWHLFGGACLMFFLAAISALAYATSPNLGVKALTLAAGFVCARFFFSTARAAARVLRRRWDVEVSATSVRTICSLGRRQRVTEFPMDESAHLIGGPMMNNHAGVQPAKLPTGVVLLSGRTTHWFAEQLQGAEAERLLKLITDRFPSLGRPVPNDHSCVARAV